MCSTGGPGGRRGPSGRMYWAGKHRLLLRVWLYVDDQLQPVKSREGTTPMLQLQPEEPPRLLLGGLPMSGTFHNFSGCISNVFVQR